ncbi:MAG: nitrogen fixation protein NifQ [Pseudomonadota bacterium]
MRPSSEIAFPSPGAGAATPSVASLSVEDRADLGAILAHALGERAANRGALPDLLGLPAPAYRGLAAMMLPLRLPDLDVMPAAGAADQRAVATLITWRGEAATPLAFWLADILARRAMEPNHLWEDLGLPTRPHLTALIGRHFPGLIRLNHANMRWKKFFYRQICSESAFSLCLAPTCDACDERSDCFAPDEA